MLKNLFVALGQIAQAQTATAAAVGSIAEDIRATRTEVSEAMAAITANTEADAASEAPQWTAPATVQQAYSLSLGGSEVQLTEAEVAPFVGGTVIDFVQAFAAKAGVTDRTRFIAFTVNGQPATAQSLLPSGGARVVGQAPTARFA